MQVILASASKRREELLKALGLKFKVVPSFIDESQWTKKIKDPKKLVLKLAWEKAKDVKRKIYFKDFLIISADTIGVFKNKIIGKPKTKKEAKTTLMMMRKNCHQVLTGLVVVNSRGKIKKAAVLTKVVFKDFTSKQIDHYLDKGFYKDRAASYGIQDEGFDFIQKYKGSYTNILGLPVEKLKQVLKEFKIVL